MKVLVIIAMVICISLFCTLSLALGMHGSMVFDGNTPPVTVHLMGESIKDFIGMFALVYIFLKLGRVAC